MKKVSWTSKGSDLYIKQVMDLTYLINMSFHFSVQGIPMSFLFFLSVCVFFQVSKGVGKAANLDGEITWDLKRCLFSQEEEDLIISLHKVLGNR